MAVSEYTPSDSANRSLKSFDVFIATPMSAYTGPDYSINRAKIIELVRLVRNLDKRADIFCPAMEIVDTAKWDLSQEALEQDMLALERADLFIMTYLRPLPKKASSVLVEAGMALALRVPSIFLVDDRSDLPYMLRDADQLSSARDRHRKSAFGALAELRVSVVETGGSYNWTKNLPLRDSIRSEIDRISKAS